jgi:hypothetical protein
MPDPLDIEPVVEAVARARYFRDREALLMAADGGVFPPWGEVMKTYRDRVRPDVMVAATPLEIQVRKRCADELRREADRLDSMDFRTARVHDDPLEERIRTLTMAAELIDEPVAPPSMPEQEGPS